MMPASSKTAQWVTLIVSKCSFTGCTNQQLFRNPLLVLTLKQRNPQSWVSV